MFSIYAALVKNLRGVVLVNPDEPGFEKSLNWLIKRFKYRNLGLTPSFVEKYRDRINKYLKGNPFRELAYPVTSILEFEEKLVKYLNFSREVSELLVFSSTYISPGLVIGDTYLMPLKSISIDSIYICKKLGLNDWKLHLRIADYTVLDMYEWCIENTEKVVERLRNGSPFSDLVNERLSLVKRDKKRYWRIACEDGKQLFLLYVDILKLIVDKAPALLKDINQDSYAALSIVPIVYIPASIES